MFYKDLENKKAASAEFSADSESGGGSTRVREAAHLALYCHCRRLVYRTGLDVPALVLTASMRAFQQCVAHAQRMPTHMSIHMPNSVPAGTPLEAARQAV